MIPFIANCVYTCPSGTPVRDGLPLVRRLVFVTRLSVFATRFTGDDPRK